MVCAFSNSLGYKKNTTINYQYRLGTNPKAKRKTQKEHGSAFTSGIDFYATLLDIAGVEIPAKQSIDGVTLVPLLRGGRLTSSDSAAAAAGSRLLFAHEPHYGNQGGEPASHVLRGDMKLILYHEVRKPLFGCLFNTGFKDQNPMQFAKTGSGQA